MYDIADLRDYFLYTVEPTLNEYLLSPLDIRKGRLAAIVLHHTDDYIFNTFMKDQGDSINTFRKKHLNQALNSRYHSLVRDVCDASKHRILTKRPDTEIKDQNQVQQTPGLFEAPFGFGVFAEAAAVEIHTNSGDVILLSEALTETHGALKRYLISREVLK